MTAQEILELVEKASGPDKIIDGEFAKLNRTMPKDAYFVVENMWGQEVNQWTGGGYGNYLFYNPEPVTDRVDEVLWFATDLLPDCRLAMYTDGEGRGPCCVVLRGDEPVVAEAHAATLPLAILAALLKALIANA